MILGAASSNCVQFDARAQSVCFMMRLEVLDRDGDTPLMIAAHEGNVEAELRCLLVGCCMSAWLVDGRCAVRVS